MSDYSRPSRDSASKAIDIERCREDFPMAQVTKPWAMMNISERAAFVSARTREAAGLPR